ncbi:hypothetical protein Trco_002200 [Trichoderma cornu-damae]|uniref:DUF7371 domain-containing protein n=1 Tax=Trichoderma cornu-damae TaxID=654480 RepID=A0A9P8TXL4_9HYPO|nr:hypothetical protein Trco_002200 [Trichoderma cornu-damae]
MASKYLQSFFFGVLPFEKKATCCWKNAPPCEGIRECEYDGKCEASDITVWAFSETSTFFPQELSNFRCHLKEKTSDLPHLQWRHHVTVACRTDVPSSTISVVRSSSSDFIIHLRIVCVCVTSDNPTSPTMRVFASLAILVASTRVQHASAQVDYGMHDGSNGGSPSGSPNTANGGPAGSTYGNPSGIPNGAPAGLPGGFPGAAPDMPTCALQGITTVFVTVYPTGHVTPSSVTQLNGIDPDQSIHQTAYPDSTILISSGGSAQGAHASVQPFTTVTIDVWGSDPNSPDAFTSDVSPVPIYTDGASDPVETSANFPDESPANTQAPWPGDSPGSNSGDHPMSSSGWVSISNGPVIGSPTATAPVNPAYGNVGDLTSISKSFVQQPSAHVSPIVTDAVVDGKSPVQMTVIGPDGKPTIIEFPSSQLGSGNSNGAGQPFPTAATPFPGFTPGPVPAASDISAAAGETMCTTYTILGPNGVPTVVHSTWVSLPTTAPVLHSSFPSLPSNPSVFTRLPDGPVIATHTTFTILGPDGLPTVVESSWLLPGPVNTAPGISGPISVSGVPNQATGTAAGVGAGGSTTCTSYTVLGPDGLPTIIDTTWVIPTPTAGAIPANVVTGVPSQFGGVSGFPPQVTATLGGVNAITTCTSYTVLGSDGLPTIVESTFVISANNALPATTAGLPLPPAQPSNFPQGVSNLPEAGGFATTCITVGVVGPDGFTTPAIQTVLIPTSGLSSAMPVHTTVGYPSLVPAQTGLPRGDLSVIPNVGFTTCITVTTLGVDGIATPVVQTIVGIPSGTELGASLSPLSTNGPSFPNPNLSSNTLIDIPNLTQYGSSGNGLPAISPPSAVVSGLVDPTGTVTGTRTSTLTVTNGPDGQPATLVPYNDQWHDQAPNAYGSPPAGAAEWTSSPLYGPPPTIVGPDASHLATALQTSTWTNVIPEQTTTYTINFPLTTMATVTLPNRRAMRRHQDTALSAVPSENSTLSMMPTSMFSSQNGFPPALPSVTVSTPPQASAVDEGSEPSPMCSTGGKIGNFTLDFDDAKTGPLFNPSRDIWFSEGFLIAPPSSQTFQSYNPSSGGQLVEFVPPSLLPMAGSNVGDTAEIGVGPNAPYRCFRFDFQGASLGCAAQGAEKWCEFEISAYRYNEALGREESIAWSETKRIPACPNFPHGSCRLTPVWFDGYANITSVLISLRVGTELRVWWGDDFKLGWNDNSCEAAVCRANAAPQPVKRETIESVARRGVWRWTARGLKRLDDGYIWESGMLDHSFPHYSCEARLVGPKLSELGEILAAAPIPIHEASRVTSASAAASAAPAVSLSRDTFYGTILGNYLRFRVLPPHPRRTDFVQWANRYAGEAAGGKLFEGCAAAGLEGVCAQQLHRECRSATTSNLTPFLPTSQHAASNAVPGTLSVLLSIASGAEGSEC